MNIPLAGRQSFNAISYTETNLFFVRNVSKLLLHMASKIKYNDEANKYI